MTYHDVIRHLGRMSAEELLHLGRAITHELEDRRIRSLQDQLNLSDELEGQRSFENELIRARKK